jgi:hypothetical protein
MRAVFLVLLALGLAPLALPQDNFAAAGVSYNHTSASALAGTAVYAHVVAGNSWFFSSLDVIPASTKPGNVATNFAPGLAQKLFTAGWLDLYTVTGAGVSWAGANTGWTWSGGEMPVVRLPRGWVIALPVRFVKSSVNNNSNYQVIATLLIGKGW